MLTICLRDQIGADHPSRLAHVNLVRPAAGVGKFPALKPTTHFFAIDSGTRGLAGQKEQAWCADTAPDFPRVAQSPPG
jgi:hypothetical protein